MNNNLNESQSLDGLFKMLKRSIFIDLHVCLPATVVSYDSATNTVDLQPAIQAVLLDNKFVTLPQIFDIPVLELGGKGLSVKIPLQAGDTGIVIFCDRDITLFKQEKKNTQPNTLRKHDLSDGIFIPMMFGNTGASSNISIESADGNTKFEIGAEGINIKGNITVDGEITATDVKTDTNVSLKNHLHGNGNQGNNTTAPIPS